MAKDIVHEGGVQTLCEWVLESELGGCHRCVTSMYACCGDSSCRHNGNNASGHFYLIGVEGCMLTSPTLGDSMDLSGGDLVIVLGEVRYVVVAAPWAAAALQRVNATATLQGKFHFRMGESSSLRRALPELVIVRSTEASPQLRTLTSLLIDSACEDRFGQKFVTNKIASSVLALALCEHIARAQALPRVLTPKDARIARVLRTIHRQLGRNCSIHSLAAIAGMSRSTFVSLFSTAVGTPPMRYVTSLRIALARQLLSDQGLSVAQVAERLGYSSETAFRKVFKRVVGIGPGKIRNARRRWLHTSDVAAQP